jgi:hypothetical protein
MVRPWRLRMHWLINNGFACHCRASLHKQAKTTALQWHRSLPIKYSITRLIFLPIICLSISRPTMPLNYYWRGNIPVSFFATQSLLCNYQWPALTVWWGNIKMFKVRSLKTKKAHTPPAGGVPASSRVTLQISNNMPLSTRKDCDTWLKSLQLIKWILITEYFSSHELCRSKPSRFDQPDYYSLANSEAYSLYVRPWPRKLNSRSTGRFAN